MKQILITLFISTSCMAGNPARLLPEFEFNPIYELGSVKLEQMKISGEISDYIITLTSKSNTVDFEWNCDDIPFLYAPELINLGQTEWYDIQFLFNSGTNTVGHYTVQPSGILISKEYITNHFSSLIESIINAKNMVITLDNAPGSPEYIFDNSSLLPAMKTFSKKCENLF